MSRFPLTGVVALAAAFAATPSVASAQDALGREVEFIRALARDLGFISLAQDQTDRLLRDRRGADEVKQIAQLGIEISLFGAKALRSDRERQRTLFKDAVDRSREFLDRYQGDPVALQAQSVLADACYEFGRFLADEVEIARSEAPDKVKELEEQAAAVFQLGRDTAEEVMNGLAAAARTDEAARFKRQFAWLRKGILLREHARAIKRDREYLADTARSTLEDLIFDVGEETVLGMRAMFELSQISEVVGKLDEARSVYRDTIGAIHEARTDPEAEMPASSHRILGMMSQEAYDRLANVLLELGRTEDIEKLATEFETRLKELGDDRDPRFGDSLMLTAARAMAESGDKTKVAKALEVAAEINTNHPTDIVGLKAKTVIREILDMQASLVNADLLLQVAMGDYQARRYEPAIQGFKRVIANVDAAQAKIGLDASVTLGKCLGAQQRALEAVIALKTGLERFGSADEKTALEAVRFLEIANNLLRRQTKNDAAMEPLFNAAVAVAARFGGTDSADKLAWRTASDLFAQNKFAEAARRFAEIGPESEAHRLAMVRRFHALKAAKDLKGATEAAEAFRTFRDANAAQPGDTNAAIADSEYAYNLADMAWMQANGEFDGNKDKTKLTEVVNLLSDYRNQYGTVNPLFTQRSLDLLARAYADLGQRARAEETYRALAKFAPDSQLVPKLATVIFSAHYDHVKTLEAEMDGAVKNGGDTKAVAAKLDDAHRATLAFGVDYNRTAPSPQYGILYLSLESAVHLGDNVRAEELATRIVDQFGNDPAEKDKVDNFVRPVLGEIKLKSGKYREALDNLLASEKQLEADGKARAAVYPVKRLICLALGGWAEIDARGEIVTSPGLGRPVEAYDSYWAEYRKFALSEQRGVTDYSLEWYRFHWEAYFAREAAGKDTSYRNYAQTLYSKAQSFDNFGALRKLGPEGEKLFNLFNQLRLR